MVASVLQAAKPSKQRFKCTECGKKFSAATLKPTYRQKKRRINATVRGSVVGQGEFKKVSYDHLFSVNHTFASVRAKINRLNRRTWCTTKKPERLADHLDIFIDAFCDRLTLLCLSPKAL